MREARLDLTGVIPPLVTPVRADRSVDIPALERLSDRLIAEGVDGLFILGSSGEGPWLRDQDRTAVIQAVVEVSDGRVPVLAGILEPGTARSLAAAYSAAEAGADAVVATSPYYFTVDPVDIQSHFTSIADESPLPVVLYNIPQMTHNQIPISVVEAMAGHPKVLGIKDSEGADPTLGSLRAIRDAHSGFRVFQGAEKASARALGAGVDGLVPGLANIAPWLFVRMVAARKEGSTANPENLQARVEALWKLHEFGFWLECLKTAVAITGYGSGLTVSPASHLTNQDRMAIEEIVRKEIEGGDPLQPEGAQDLN